MKTRILAMLCVLAMLATFMVACSDPVDPQDGETTPPASDETTPVQGGNDGSDTTPGVPVDEGGNSLEIFAAVVVTSRRLLNHQLEPQALFNVELTVIQRVVDDLAAFAVTPLGIGGLPGVTTTAANISRELPPSSTAATPPMS